MLPYHECDRLSRDQPDYLACLVHLQVQNISARYPVFITGESDITLIVASSNSCLKVTMFLSVVQYFSLPCRDDNKQLVWHEWNFNIDSELLPHM